jgi:hypothetical protein
MRTLEMLGVIQPESAVRDDAKAEELRQRLASLGYL